MIEKFGEQYKAILEDSEGPRLSIQDIDGNKRLEKIIDVEDSQSDSAEYKERIEKRCSQYT